MKNKAIEVARSAEGQFRLGSVLVRGRRIVSTGTNLTKTHPMQGKYAKKSGYPRRIYLHAEIRALIKTKKKGDTLFVARLSKNGYSLRLAKPCQTCRLALASEGVKKVVYSVSNNNWETMELEE